MIVNTGHNSVTSHPSTSSFKADHDSNIVKSKQCSPETMQWQQNLLRRLEGVLRAKKIQSVFQILIESSECVCFIWLKSLVSPIVSKMLKSTVVEQSLHVKRAQKSLE